MRESYILYQSIFQPVPALTAEQVLESKFHFSWSEPVRFRRIHVSRIASGLTWNPQQPLPPTSPWFRPLSEPSAYLRKRGLGAWQQRVTTQDTEFTPEPNTLFGAWFPQLALPVRLPKGLRARYHPFFFYHPRVLPTPDVPVVLDATEINSDMALFGIDVGEPDPPPPSQEGASVTIVEVPAQQDGSLSIQEP